MGNVKKLFGILGEYKYNYLFSGFLLIIGTLIRTFEPRVLQVAVDNILTYFAEGKARTGGDFVTTFLLSLLPEFKADNLNSILIWTGLLYVIVALLRGTFSFVSGIISANSTEKAIKNLKDNLFMHLQRLPLSYYSKTPTGEVIQRSTGDVETVRKFASMQLTEIVRLSFILVGAFVMMASIDMQYALIATIIVPIAMIMSVIFFKKEGVIWEKHEHEQDKLSIIVQENLSGVRVVKAFAKENYEKKKFNEQNDKNLWWGLKHLRLHMFYWPFSDVLIHIQVVISIFFGAMFALEGRITIGELTAFYSYALLVTWPMRRIGQIVGEMSMTNVALDRMYSILGQKEESYAGDKPAGNLKGDIEFRNIAFAYGEDKGVLRDINFKVKAGEKIGIIGPAGAGKTTLMSLLVRFYEPDSGEVIIDGRNAKEYSVEYLRDRIGLVLQRSFLFSTTLKNNIAYSNPEADIDTVTQYAQAASVHGIITEAFPQQYDTVVGEKGVTLSGGQKQRIAIARTLLKNPDILILDDSLSAVDTETEGNIQNALETLSKDKTTFVIAHRITSVSDCNRIIVMKDGKIAEMGTHEELLENGGFYKRIFDIQNSVEEDIKNEVGNSVNLVKS